MAWPSVEQVRLPRSITATDLLPELQTLGVA
jgi:hypothetical protein